jgi:acetyl-CoA C-acetyltransferase
MKDDQTPVLIGVGEATEKDPDLDIASSPLDLMQAATVLAAEDAEITLKQLEQLDALVVVKSFREPTRNSPQALANRLGALRTQQWLVPDGGHAPQYLVNRFAESIATGKSRFVLLTGAEAMATGRRIVKSTGKQPDWQEPATSDPVLLYPDRPMSSEHEVAHGIWQASHVYPMFENALRKHYRHTIAQHQQALGELFSRFTEIAAESPHSWYPIRRTAGEITTATAQNRYVGWPYTKYMNAMNQINQSASVLLTSVGFAERLGIDPARFVYLHGCADTAEEWSMADRLNFHSSPAIRLLGEQALGMAGLSIDDIEYLDLYSCFPSAVQIARDELGIATDDRRSLTITGGLPFHGGAGNNYVMNSIAAMVGKLREDPGTYGLVTANGGYLEKHAAGIYSTLPTTGTWGRPDPGRYQQLIENRPHPSVEENPSGPATVETYTVIFGRDNTPERGMVIGRVGDGSDPGARRFYAFTPPNRELLESMVREDQIGRMGTVQKYEGINQFRPGN